MSDVIFEFLFIKFVRMYVFSLKYMTTILIYKCGQTNKEKRVFSVCLKFLPTGPPYYQ